MILVNCFRKSVLVLVQLFLRVTHPWVPLVKNIVWSQSVDVARWVRPAIEHAQDVLSYGLGQEWEYDFMLVFKGSCFVLTFYVILFLVFLLFLWLCPFLKNQIVFGLGLSCDFLMFYYFFFRLGNSLQKNKLSSFKLV